MSWFKSIKSALNKTPEPEGSPAGAGSNAHPSLTEILDQIPTGSRIRPRDWSRIRALHRQADELQQAGAIMEGRALSVEALQLALEKGGREDPGVGACFFHFALGVENSGDLIGAEQNYNAAAGILQVTEGEATPLKAEVLLHYGMAYMSMGLGWRAILMLDWAKAHFETLYGPDDENVGRALMGIATSYEMVGVEDGAIDTYDEALRIITRAWGPTNPRVTYTRWARADLAFWRALKSGDQAAAGQELDTIRAGLQQIEEQLGPDHPAVAERRAHLGSNLIASGREEEGAGLLAEAIAILEAAGQPVPGYRRQLARIQARTGQAEAALSMLRRAFQEDRPIGEQIAHGSERERAASLQKVVAHLELFLDVILLAGQADDPTLAAEVCQLFLSYRALGAELLFWQRQAVASTEDPELHGLMDQLAELRARQAAQSLAGDEYDPQLGVEIERVEWELASRIPEMDARSMTSFTPETAARLLPEASALIEFVYFARQSTSPAGDDRPEQPSPRWAAALVITSDGQEVRLVDLGPAGPINGLIRSYLFSLGIVDVLSLPGAGSESSDSLSIEDDSDEKGQALRRLLLDPLWPFIHHCRRLFLAPDGELLWFPFEILPQEPGRYLIDALDISYLSVGRDLGRLSSRRESAPSTSPVVLADPNYDGPRGAGPQSGEGQSTPGAPAKMALPGAGRDQLRSELNRRIVQFKPLPGTRAEGIAIASLLGVEPLLGAEASERRLKAVRSPLVLHVATHGYYFPDEPEESSAASSQRGSLKAAASRNPLVRSGIVLSGVNSWLSQGAPPDYIDDGIVSGEDVVGMDLSGTEMVVLSACQTGLGDLMTGEGVLGLRRAFMVAGTKTLILSLWSVPDKQTRLLMTHFYERLLGGDGRAAALRKAQQHVRAQYPDPFYWAAFVCVGDPEPIARLAALAGS